MNGHWSNIKCSPAGRPVVMQFNIAEYSINNLPVRVTEKQQREDAANCNMRKSWWISTLRLVTPHGLNHDEDKFNILKVHGDTPSVSFEVFSKGCLVYQKGQWDRNLENDGITVQEDLQPEVSTHLGIREPINKTLNLLIYIHSLMKA